MKNNLLKTLLPAGALLAFATLASAAIVTPRGSGIENTTDNAGLTASGTLLASVSSSATGTQTPPGTTLTIDYTESVFRDNTNCANCLDFVITATNDAASNTILESISAASFGGASTIWMGYNGVGAAPNDVSLSGDGNVAKFYFAGVSPGSSTATLVIETNATTYVPGSVTFQDGASATGAGFGVAPEPNMTYLLSVLALGILGLAYRRNRNAVKDTQAS